MVFLLGTTLACGPIVSSRERQPAATADRERPEEKSAKKLEEKPEKEPVLDAPAGMPQPVPPILPPREGNPASKRYPAPPTDKSVMKRLVSLARHADPKIREAAMTALLRSDRKLRNPAVLDPFRQALSSEDPSNIIFALSSLGNYNRYFPKMMPLLLHPDPLVRQYARKGISVAKSNLQPDHANKVADMLTGVLRDKERSADHLAAIRAMSAMLTKEGPYVESGYGGGGMF